MRRQWLFQLIGIILFAVILWKLDLKLVLDLFANARPFELAVAFSLSVPFILFKVVRWRFLLKMQNIDYGFKNSLLVYLGGIYLGLVTPGRLGDFVKVLHLKADEDVSYTRGFSTVFVDRLFDLLILVSMALAGGFAVGLSRDISLVILSVVLTFVLAVFILLNASVGTRAIRILFNVILPKKYRDSATVPFATFYECIERFKKPAILYPLLLTVLGYLTFFVQCYFIALSLNIEISFINVALSISAANLVSLLPISISGIGTRDVTLISIYSALNLSKESALAFSISFLIVSNVSGALMGAVAWMLKPINTAR